MTAKINANFGINFPKTDSPAQIRLFCFHYAGGNATVFRTWSQHLPPTIEVFPIELPGRGRQINLPSFIHLDPLVNAAAEALLPYLHKPFAIFGYSMGALIGFELTRILRSKYNITPLHLFVAARRAPQIPDPKPPIYDLPDAELIQEIIRLNGTPNAVIENQELMRLFIPILRADFRVLDTYNYTNQSPLTCPITVFGGLQDKEISYDYLTAWQEQTTASFAIRMLDGDHFFIHSSPSLLFKTIAEKLES